MFFGSVQIKRRLASQRKFQMFAVYLPAAILKDQGGPPTYIFARNISTNISTLGQRTHLKLGDLSSLFIVYNITLS